MKDDFALIHITSKKHGDFVTQSDVEDLPEVSQYNWFIHRKRQAYYVTSYVWIDGRKTLKELQNFLMQTPKGMVTDHIDRDPLNNTRNNLRVVSNRANHHNMSRHAEFIGVRPCTTIFGFYARVKVGNKYYTLPALTHKEHAAFVYDSIMSFIGEIPPNGVTLTERERKKVGELLYAASRKYKRNIIS